MKLDGLKCQVKRIRKVIQGKDLYQPPRTNHHQRQQQQSQSSCEDLTAAVDTDSTTDKEKHRQAFLLQYTKHNEHLDKEIIDFNNNNSANLNSNNSSNFYEDIENWDLTTGEREKMMAGMLPQSSSSSGGSQYGHHAPSHHQLTNSSAGIVATLHGTGGSGGGSSAGGSAGNSSVEDSERLFLSESDVIHLLLEFLSSRGLTSSQVELERETSIVNEVITSPDLIFLRSLIVDGRWEDVTEFLQPLEEAFRTFPGKKVRATILKHRFLDILASYAGPGAQMTAGGTFTTEEGKSGVVEDLVKVC